MGLFILGERMKHFSGYSWIADHRLRFLGIKYFYSCTQLSKNSQLQLIAFLATCSSPQIQPFTRARGGGGLKTRFLEPFRDSASCSRMQGSKMEPMTFVSGNSCRYKGLMEEIQA